MRSTTFIAALAATATLGVAASADAATFCVGNHPDCPAGSTQYSLPTALGLAKTNPGHDVVRVGAGEYPTQNGFSYAQDTPGNTLELVGAGPGTILKADAAAKPSFTTLTVAAAGPSRVANLTVVAPKGLFPDSETRGAVLDTGVVAEDVAVKDDGATTQGADEGILVKGGSGVRRSSVTMNKSATGIRVKSSTTASIADTVVDAEIGIHTDYSDGVVEIRRSRIRASFIGVLAVDGITNVESTLIRADGDSSVGLWAMSATGTMLNASHLTMVGTGADTEGVVASAGSGYDAHVKLDNSIVYAFTRGVRRTSNHASSDADVSLTNVNYSAANDQESGTGAIQRVNTSQQKPGFLDWFGEDYRLSPTSVLVDKGRPESYVWIMGKDLAGNDREVGARRDLGAFETQALAPVAAIGGAAEVDPGQALALSGGQSHDQDPGDAIMSWQWSFGDGTTAAGKDVEHAWTQPGTYEVALTVTDRTGNSHTAKTSVLVRTPPVQTSGGGDSGGGTGGPNGGGGPVADTTAPVIGALRRRGRAVRFSLSEVAAVTLKVQRKSGSRYRAVGRAQRLAGKSGANALRIAKLRPGRYRLVVTAVDAAGNRSVKRLAFRVS